VLQHDKRPVDGIAGIVHGAGANLLVVGARGRSKTMAILLGAVTERLIEICNVPILTVKKKGQGMSFLEALFDI
jgi:nucleotide-binding universal stress UspA family protein